MMTTAVRYTLIASLLGAAAVASADPRSFGVLPEGDLRVSRQGSFSTVVPLADGRVAVDGFFHRVNGERMGGPLILETDGRPDSGFRLRCDASFGGVGARPCGDVRLFALRDGGFVMTGSFSMVNGVGRHRVARFRADGSLEPNFDPLAGSGITAAESVAVSNQWLYLRIPSSKVVRRVALEPPFALDAGYAAPDVAQVAVVDNQDRLFEIASAGGPAFLRRRDRTGAIDPSWSSGLAEPPFRVFHEATTNQLFVQTSTTLSDDVRRVDPDSGLDPTWRLLTPSDQGLDPDLRVSLVAMGQARLLVERWGNGLPGDQRFYSVHDATAGQPIASRLLPSRLQFNAAGRALDWYAIDSTFSGTAPARSLVVRFGPTLEEDLSLSVQAEAPGAVYGLTRDGQGGFFAVGDFEQIGGLPRARIARLNGDFSIDASWPPAPRPRPRYPLQAVAIGSDGTLITAEAGPSIIFGGVFRGQLLATGADGQQTTRRDFFLSASRTLLVDGAARLIDPGDQLCRLTPGRPQLAISRIALNTLLLPQQPPLWGCTVLTEWEVTGPFVLAVAADADWVYYVQMPPVSGSGTAQVRRISLVSGSAPDPAWGIQLSAPPPTPPSTTTFVDASLLATPEGIYVWGNFNRVGSQTMGGFVRLSLDTGQVDPSWTSVPVDPMAFLTTASSDSDFVYLRQTRSQGFGITRRGLDGQAPSREISAEVRWMDWAPNAQLLGSVFPLGDGRAAVLGNFRSIDGVLRDGFAIVGDVEAILSDGFE